MSFSPSLSDPSIMHMMESAGLAMLPLVGGSVFEVTSPTSQASLGAYIADRNLKEGAYHSSYGVVKLIEATVGAMNIDGFIWNYTYNCRPMAQTSHFLTKWVRETTGIPTLSMETDHFDSRSYSAAALRTRVEAFAELLRARKALSGV